MTGRLLPLAAGLSKTEGGIMKAVTLIELTKLKQVLIIVNIINDPNNLLQHYDLQKHIDGIWKTWNKKHSVALNPSIRHIKIMKSEI